MQNVQNAKLMTNLIEVITLIGCGLCGIPYDPFQDKYYFGIHNEII